jgi:hypothetical protein
MHWQNLNEKHGKTGFPWHGRAWFGEFHVEWKLPTRSVRLNFHRDDEGATVGIACLLFAFWFGWSRFSARDDRECQITVHHGCLWVALWRDPSGTSSRQNDPWWRHQHCFDFADFFLGRQTHSKETVETRDVLIPMPEGSYPATVEFVRAKWKRPRWFALVKTCADVKIPKGIPFEGKGDNSWDCGEDATFGMWTPAASIEEAIGKVVSSVLRDRNRYGTPSRLQDVVAA